MKPEKVPHIFFTFKQLGLASEKSLLHLFTIPEYEHRHYVYDTLSDIGIKICIDFFEAMKLQDTEYQDKIDKGLQQLRTRHNL